MGEDKSSVLAVSTSAVRKVDAVVLDTNVVLDWLVFKDPAALFLGPQLRSGAWTWVGTRAMLEELRIVLSRPGLERWQPDEEAVLDAFRTWCRICPEPALTRSARWPCSDPDDQKFIDLALEGADVRWLFTRDKALLKLARRARHRDLKILRPEDWPERSA